jgi:hypothetical protein
MRKVVVIALLFAFCGVYALGQDFHKGELSAGWNYLHYDTGAGTGGATESSTDGFYVDGTYYFLHYIGFTGRYEYNKKTFDAGTITGPGGPPADAGTHTVVFGPRLKYRFGRVEPFGHGLFGFTRIGVTPRGFAEESDTAFAMKFGGGADVGVSHHLGIRVFEFNYFLTRFNNAANSDIHLNGKGTQNNWTISAGIVLH